MELSIPGSAVLVSSERDSQADDFRDGQSAAADVLGQVGSLARSPPLSAHLPPFPVSPRTPVDDGAC